MLPLIPSYHNALKLKTIEWTLGVSLTCNSTYNKEQCAFYPAITTFDKLVPEWFNLEAFPVHVIKISHHLITSLAGCGKSITYLAFLIDAICRYIKEELVAFKCIAFLFITALFWKNMKHLLPQECRLKPSLGLQHGLSSLGLLLLWMTAQFELSFVHGRMQRPGSSQDLFLRTEWDADPEAYPPWPWQLWSRIYM